LRVLLVYGLIGVAPRLYLRERLRRGGRKYQRAKKQLTDRAMPFHSFSSLS